MRPKPEFPRGQYVSIQARREAIAIYESELLSWYKALVVNPMVQRILDIPTKGPIFILDARDIYAPETIDFWLAQAYSTVSPEKFDEAAKDYQEILEWQNQNPEKVKIPD